MKKIIVTITILTLIITVLFTGCDVLIKADGDNATGSGNLETRQFDFTDFTKVDIGNAFEYEIIQSDTYSVLITADDNLFEDIRVSKKGQTLKVHLRPFFHLSAGTLEAVITMPRLTGLESTGASRGTITGFHSGDDLDFIVTGGSRVDFTDITTGDIKGNLSGDSIVNGAFTTGDTNIKLSGDSDFEGSLQTHNIEYDLSGASRIKVYGSGNDIVIHASGASRLELGEFSVNNAKISMSGASICKINVNGKIDVDLSGGSTVNYTGQPAFGKIDLSGGSTINNEAAD